MTDSAEITYFVRKVKGQYQLESCGGVSKLKVTAKTLAELTSKATVNIVNPLTLQKIKEAINDYEE